MDPPADSPRQAGRPPKRIRTTKPCDYCKQKKIRCQFPQEQDGTTSKTLPCEHCVQFGLVCIVAGVERQNQQPAMVSVLTVHWNFPIFVADDFCSLHRSLLDRLDHLHLSVQLLALVIRRHQVWLSIIHQSQLGNRDQERVKRLVEMTP